MGWKTWSFGENLPWMQSPKWNFWELPARPAPEPQISRKAGLRENPQRLLWPAQQVSTSGSLPQNPKVWRVAPRYFKPRDSGHWAMSKKKLQPKKHVPKSWQSCHIFGELIHSVSFNLPRKKISGCIGNHPTISNPSITIPSLGRRTKDMLKWSFCTRSTYIRSWAATLAACNGLAPWSWVNLMRAQSHSKLGMETKNGKMRKVARWNFGTSCFSYILICGSWIFLDTGNETLIW